MRHAADGMLNVYSQRWLHDSCRTKSHIIFQCTKIVRYRKQLAGDDVVGILSQLCFQDSCTKLPNYNLKGSKKEAYCRQHTENGIVTCL